MILRCRSLRITSISLMRFDSRVSAVTSKSRKTVTRAGKSTTFIANYREWNMSKRNQKEKQEQLPFFRPRLSKPLGLPHSTLFQVEHPMSKLCHYVSQWSSWEVWSWTHDASVNWKWNFVPGKHKKKSISLRTFQSPYHKKKKKYKTKEKLKEKLKKRREREEREMRERPHTPQDNERSTSPQRRHHKSGTTLINLRSFWYRNNVNWHSLYP